MMDAADSIGGSERRHTPETLINPYTPEHTPSVRPDKDRGEDKKG